MKKVSQNYFHTSCDAITKYMAIGFWFSVTNLIAICGWDGNYAI